MNSQHAEVLQKLHNRLCALESGAGLCAHTRVQDLGERSEKRTPRETARWAKMTDRGEGTVDTLAQRDRVLGEQRELQELRDLEERRKQQERLELKEYRVVQAEIREKEEWAEWESYLKWQQQRQQQREQQQLHQRDSL